MLYLKGHSSSLFPYYSFLIPDIWNFCSPGGTEMKVPLFSPHSISLTLKLSLSLPLPLPILPLPPIHTTWPTS